MLSLAVGVWSSGCSLVYLTYDADLTDFDPRPAVRRLLARQGVVHARNDLNWVAASVWHETRPVVGYVGAVARIAAANGRLTAANAAVALLLLVAPHTPENTR